MGESKEEFPGINPEFGVPIGEQVADYEIDRSEIIDQLEVLIDALNSQMSLEEVATTLRAVASQLDREHSVSVQRTFCEENGVTPEEQCRYCEGSYVCANHSGTEGVPAYEN